MNAGIAIILFVSVAIIYMVIIDLCILLFRILGLTQEQARFQVISLWTNCGYTTNEAEIIVNVPARRHLARMIMLFGNIFSVTIISLFVNAILTLPRYEAHEVLPFILGTGAGFLAFILIRRKPSVRKYFDDKITQAAEKRMHGKESNSIILLDELTNSSLSKVILNRVPQSLKGTPINKLGLEDKGIHPLYYHAPNQPVKLVTDDTKLHPNTSLTVVGPLKSVREFFIEHFENECERDESKIPDSNNNATSTANTKPNENSAVNEKQSLSIIQNNQNNEDMQNNEKANASDDVNQKEISKETSRTDNKNG